MTLLGLYVTASRKIHKSVLFDHIRDFDMNQNPRPEPVFFTATAIKKKKRKKLQEQMSVNCDIWGNKSISTASLILRLKVCYELITGIPKEYKLVEFYYLQ